MVFFRVLYESQYVGAIGTGSLKQVPTLDCFWTSGRGFCVWSLGLQGLGFLVEVFGVRV